MYFFPNFEQVGCSTSDSNCCFLICTQVSQETGKVVCYSHLFKNFPQFVMINTVNETEVDNFLEFPCFLYDPTDVGNLISGSSTFSKSGLYIWKFLVYVPLKSSLKDFENNFSKMWNESQSQASSIVHWTWTGISFHTWHFTCFNAILHWDDPEGWYGEGGGRRVQDGFSFKNLEIKEE